MNADLGALVTTTDKDVQYDNNVKQLLGRKIILAHILKNTIEEFRGLDPKTIVTLIEGEVQIGTVPVDPGYTNKKIETVTGKIVGFNTENQELNEGMIRFDIIFYVRMKDGLSQVIVNVEAQKDEPTAYHILNRVIFYACRMISSQKERDFVNKDFNRMKRVYSIWICMNMTENSLSHIHLKKDDILGMQNWRGDLDLVNIVMVGVKNDLPPKEEAYELHRFLTALLSAELTVDKKLDVLEQEYGFQEEFSIREEVKYMCNLSQGIREKGREEGREEGRENEIFSSVKNRDYSIQTGMQKLNISDEETFRKKAAERGFIIP